MFLSDGLVLKISYFYVIFFVIFLQVCKGCLRVIVFFMGFEFVNKMFQKYLLEEGYFYFGEFMNDLLRFIVSDIFLLFLCYINVVNQKKEKRGLMIK